MFNRFDQIIKNLLALSDECEWVEFKQNNSDPDEIGEYISALANGAAYHGQNSAYLVFGIEDKTHVIKGTTFKPKQAKKGNSELENWIATQLDPRADFTIHEFEYEGHPLALFKNRSC